MNTFHSFVSECGEMGGEPMLPSVEPSMEVTASASIDDESFNIFDPLQRDILNTILSDITDGIGTPAVIYERVRFILDGIGYLIPPASSFTDLFTSPEGEEILGLSQPQPPDVNAPEPALCYLYFAFSPNTDDEDSPYEILAEVVTLQGLEELLSDNESDDI